MGEVGVGPLAALVTAAFLAGVVDAIGGGGGLITLPALLLSGLSPHAALGTNKGQSVFGSGAALAGFVRSGRVNAAQARWAFPMGFFGSLIGAMLVSFLSPDLLRPLVLVLLCAVGVVMLARPSAGTPSVKRVVRRPVMAASCIAFAIGAYDGFFGPGTGTFLILAFMWWLEVSPTEASADAKVVNFASNLAAVLWFGLQSLVVWPVALLMGMGQLAGGWTGAHLAMRRGDVLVRGVMGVVLAGLIVKLAVEMWGR